MKTFVYYAKVAAICVAIAAGMVGLFFLQAVRVCI